MKWQAVPAISSSRNHFTVETAIIKSFYLIDL
jgi:hypothetical protein